MVSGDFVDSFTDWIVGEVEFAFEDRFTSVDESFESFETTDFADGVGAEENETKAVGSNKRPLINYDAAERLGLLPEDRQGRLGFR